MTDRTESGRLSIAGFLYQIVGSGAESCQVTLHVENDDDAGEILEMEQLGQDLAALPIGGGIARLIQFKYSSKYAEVKPSELRKILQTFLVCVEEAEKQVKEFKGGTGVDQNGDLIVLTKADVSAHEVMFIFPDHPPLESRQLLNDENGTRGVTLRYIIGE